MATPSAAPEAVSVAEAARIIGRSVATIQHWIREQGAPTESLGGCGRGHGSRVNLQKLLEWRAGRAIGAAALPESQGRDLPRLFDQALWRVYTKPAEGRTSETWRLHGMKRTGAAAMLFDIFQELYREATGRLPTTDELPPHMRDFLSISVDSVHRRVTQDTADG